MRHTWR